MSTTVSRPDGPVPTFSVSTRDVNYFQTGRTAHPAGRHRHQRRLDFDALEEIAVGLAQSVPGRDYAWTDGTRRRYACLLDTPLYDAWLIEWSPSSNLELHDHGGSQGVVFVAAGRVVETYTDLDQRHCPRTQIVDAGEAFSIAATRVHEMSNPGPADALSVHVYSPPLRAMTFFDHRPDSFLIPLQTTRGDLAELEEVTI